MTTLSIIIVNYKSWEHLGICLDSIQNQKKINPEIIVLDNNSLNKLVPSITKLNPNKSTSGHKHAGQEEVYVFYKGRGIMQIDDAKFEVKQGDVIPVPDGAFHRVFNDENEILEFAAIFNGERHTEDKPK